jgi:hypothetical protein
MICTLNELGVGNSSRQGAKSPSLEGKDMNAYEKLSPVISDLRGLCVFAGDIPRFGCGCGALGPSW